MDLLQIPYWTTILVTLFIIIFITKLNITNIITKKPTTQNLPPGPRKLPLVGNIHNLIGLTPPHRTLHKLAVKFGPVIHLQLGELSTVVISSADAVKHVVKIHDINISSRPTVASTEILSYGCTSLICSPYGDYWRQVRKICVSELLTTKRVLSFRSVREHVFLDLATWLAANSQEVGPPVNLTEKLHSSGYALISRLTLGKKTEVKDRLVLIIKEAIELVAGFSIADVYPSIKLLRMMSGLKRRVKTLHQERDMMLDEIIHEHKLALTGNAMINISGGGVDHKQQHQEKEEDLLDVLLRFQDDHGLTTDNVKAVLLDMFGAGSETSTTTIGWAMAEMMRNPRVLKRAQDEVRRFFDDKGSYVDESKINELKYLKSIIKETMRLHPVPLLPRKCTQKCEIDGYEITADTNIIINAWAINRDPKYWKNADCFEPERFLDNLVDYKGNHFEYIPFGAGRRMCPGISFGLANVELSLAMFLYHFDWKLPDGMKHEELDMTEDFGITGRRKNDLFVVPVLKRPLPPHVR